MNPHKQILIVDDDERVRFVLENALVRMDEEYKIVTAANGHEALGYAQQEHFDLIITDLRMPEVDGIELTASIKAIDGAVAIIWVTAYGCHTVREQANELEIWGCLDKPLEINEIRQAVREALSTLDSAA
jgi:CheY-like chemotaxis protein